MKKHYTCLIVEDEPLAQQLLTGFVNAHPSLALSGVCKDALAAQQALQEKAIDILLLDIELPTLSGISLLQTLSHHPVAIFTTAYPQYAVAGFEMDAADFLLKPFSFERFLKAINKAISIINQPAGQGLHPLSLFVRMDKKVYQLQVADILYLSTDDDYTNIVTTSGSYFVNDTLKSLLEQLPAADFLRVHKSHAVARKHIVFIEGNYIRAGDKDIPVGAAYKDVISRFLQTEKPKRKSS
nr:LytTR family DNA-binding domain-containing protein [uncultured Chitinophaga sp.]